MEEKWKAICGYENYYEISNLGKVKSLKRKVKVLNSHDYSKYYLKTYNEKI